MIFRHSSVEPRATGRLLAGSVLVVLMVVGTIGAQAESDGVREERVTVSRIVGKAQLRRKNSAQWRPMRVGMTVRTGWDIRTYVESRVELRFETGTVMRVGENSVVQLSKLLHKPDAGAVSSSVRISTGEVWSNVQKLVNKRSKFEFETPTATASIRGTSLGVSVNTHGTAVDVFEGRVEVRSRRSQKRVEVTTQMRAFVPGNTENIRVVKLSDVRDEAAAADALPPVVDSTMVEDPSRPARSGQPEAEPGNDDDSGQGDAPRDSSAEERGDEQETGTPPDDRETPGESGEEADDAHGQMPAAGRGTALSGLDAGQEEESGEPSTGDIPIELFEPADGARLDQPSFSVQGRTSPGARVMVNGRPVSAGSDGSFSHAVHIPDEEGEYLVRVTAARGSAESEERRTVEYVRPATPLELQVISPSEGATIGERMIRVTGKTSPRARLTIANSRVLPSVDGSFTFSVPVTERNLGHYTLEISAEDGSDEKTVSVPVTLDIGSPQLNVSKPRVMVTNKLGRAVRGDGRLQVQASDQTPGDHLTLTVEINGSVDTYRMENNEKEQVQLDEGANSYRISATDLAGNQSSAEQGDVYYLPGPLTLDILDPPRNPYRVEHLPPLPPGSPQLSVDLDVEVYDGIGTVPGTIRYCRARSDMQDIYLDGHGPYRYTGSIGIRRGMNRITISAEDIAGNRVVEELEVIVEE